MVVLRHDEAKDTSFIWQAIVALPFDASPVQAWMNSSCFVLSWIDWIISGLQSDWQSVSWVLEKMVHRSVVQNSSKFGQQKDGANVRECVVSGAGRGKLQTQTKWAMFALHVLKCWKLEYPVINPVNPVFRISWIYTNSEVLHQSAGHSRIETSLPGCGKSRPRMADIEVMRCSARILQSTFLYLLLLIRSHRLDTTWLRSARTEALSLLTPRTDLEASHPSEVEDYKSWRFGDQSGVFCATGHWRIRGAGSPSRTFCCHCALLGGNQPWSGRNEARRPFD